MPTPTATDPLTPIARFINQAARECDDATVQQWLLSLTVRAAVKAEGDVPEVSRRAARAAEVVT